MKKPSKTIVAALLPIALLLGACGGTNESSLSSEEASSTSQSEEHSSAESVEESASSSQEEESSSSLEEVPSSSSESSSEVPDIPSSSSSESTSSSEESSSSEPEPVVEPITVDIADPANATIEVGKTLQLEYKVDNNVDNLPLQFASDNTAVLTVDANGLVTAVAIGTANVTLTVGEASDTVALTVVNPQAASIEIVLDHTTLAVGETIEVGAKILPEGADQDYTVTVSNEIYLSVDGHKVTALMASDTPLTITVSTANGLTDTAEVMIGGDELYVMQISDILKASAEIEKTSLSEASLLAESTSTYDFSGSADYHFYSDNASLTEIEYDDGEKASTTNFIDGDTLYTIEQNGEGGIESIEQSLIAEDPDWDEVSPEEAQTAVSMPTYPDSYGDPGFSSYVLEEYFDDYSGLLSEDATNIDLQVEGFKYTLKGEIGGYSDYTYLTIELTVNEDGLIVEGMVDAEIHESDWDTGRPYPEISGQVTFTFTQTAGEKTPSNGNIVTPDDLRYTDFNLYWSTDYSGETDAGANPTLETGKTAYIFPKDIAPVTAYYDADPVSVSVSPAEGANVKAAYSGYSGYFASAEFSQPGHYVITVKTTNVEKTIECDVVAPAVKGIAFGPANYANRNWLPSTIVAGTQHEFLVNVTPSNATGNIHAEIIDDTAGATIEAAESANSFVVTAAHAGTFTVKVYEETLGEEHAITKTVTVYGNDDASIATMLDQATIADNTGDKTLDFVKTGETGGTFAYRYVEEGYYGGVTTYEIAGNWEIAGGELILSDVTYACDDEYTDVEAPYYGEAFTNYDFKCFRFTYDVDYDTANDYVYLK